MGRAQGQADSGCEAGMGKEEGGLTAVRPRIHQKRVHDAACYILGANARGRAVVEGEPDVSGYPRDAGDLRLALPERH